MAIQQTSANLVEELPPYITSEAVEEVADEVISSNVGFRDLEELRIVYLLRTDQPLDPDDEIDTIVTVTKASPVWHAASGIDAIVAVKKPNWDLWGDKQRRALLTHGFSHLLVTEEGKLKKVGHDAEVFVREVNQFGSWHPSLMKLRRSLEDGTREPTTQVTLSSGGKSVTTDSDALADVARDPGKITELANRAKKAREGGDE